MEKTVQPLPFELNVVERCGNSLRVKNGAADRILEDLIDSDASARSELQEIVDILGENSARAQGLKSPITCLQSFLSAAPDVEQRLYIVTLNRRETNERRKKHVVVPQALWEKSLSFET